MIMIVIIIFSDIYDNNDNGSIVNNDYCIIQTLFEAKFHSNWHVIPRMYHLEG